MSYLRKIEYRVIPEESYKIIRNCSGCGCKMSYENTGKFRVNANGSQIDVWLIYQCSKCRHTYNLSIYERVRPSEIPEADYNAYMENNLDLAYRVGTDKQMFTNNRAEIDWDNVTVKVEGPENIQEFAEGDLIEITNPSGAKIRIDKMGAQILGMSRSRFSQAVKQERIIIQDNTILINKL